MEKVLFIADQQINTSLLFEKLNRLPNPTYTLNFFNKTQKSIEDIVNTSASVIVIFILKDNTYESNYIKLLTNSAPDVPVIIIGDYNYDEVYKKLPDTIGYNELDAAIKQALEDAKKGYISGVSLPIALQMIELEAKTCTITVKSEHKKGILFFRNGELLDASYLDNTGADAALEIIGWPNASMEFQNFCIKQQKNINMPLTFLLIEASRKTDETQDISGTYDYDDGNISQSTPQQGSIETLGMDFSEETAPAFDFEEAMKEGVLAPRLNEIQKAFAKAIGPVAKAIFKKQVNEWAKDNAPSLENLPHLTDILCTEIDEEDAMLEFRQELRLD